MLDPVPSGRSEDSSWLDPGPEPGTDLLNLRAQRLACQPGQSSTSMRPGAAANMPNQLLDGFDGILQVDGYAGYNRADRHGGRKGGAPLQHRVLLTDATAHEKIA